MEFTITCPVDGVVQVGLEDIETVVLREAEHADITFVCPHCGSAITVTAIVPSFLLAAIEALAEDGEVPVGSGFVVVGVSPDNAGSSVPQVDDGRADAYCEYFRRQLEDISCAADALDEIDSKTHSQ